MLLCLKLKVEFYRELKPYTSHLPSSYVALPLYYLAPATARHKAGSQKKRRISLAHPTSSEPLAGWQRWLAFSETAPALLSKLLLALARRRCHGSLAVTRCEDRRATTVLPLSSDDELQTVQNTRHVRKK